MKVLLLDDAAVVRDRLAAALSDIPGLEVVAEEVGTSGVEARVLTLRPDVLIIDVRSAQARGLELIRRLKASQAATVVIAISSFPSFRYRAKCHEAGASFYFDKVVEQDRLLEAITGLREELA